LNPLKDFLFDPDPEIGGGIVPMLGMPGSGKTVGLTQIALAGLNRDDYVMWRGTKQAQWKHVLANDVEVVLWNHSSINEVDAFISSEKSGEQETSVDLSQHGVEMRSWENADEVVQGLVEGKLNVVNIPGLTGDKSDMYFFRKKWVDIFTALTERRSGRMIVFPFDEIGDVVPSSSQLRSPFYSLIAEDLPPKLAQLRKKRVMLYGAAHSHHDIHHFLSKVKANTILYMSNSIVNNQVTPSVDQGTVSGLDRGEFVFPPRTKPANFDLPAMPESLDWIPSNSERMLNLDWSYDAPDLLDSDETDDGGDGGDGRTGDMSKAEAAKILYNYSNDNADMPSLTMEECGEVYDVSQSAVAKSEL